VQCHHHNSSIKQINVVQTLRESKSGHYTLSLFYWTNVACHFPVPFRRACGRSAEWPTLIRKASPSTNSADQMYSHFPVRAAMATPSYTTSTISIKIQHYLNTLTQHTYYAFDNLFSVYEGQFLLWNSFHTHRTDIRMKEGVRTKRRAIHRLLPTSEP